MRGPIITFKRARRLRREMSLPEVLLWRHLRGHGVGGLRFRRQHPVGPYVLDFFCVEMLLCIEVDGYAHDNAESAAHDARRTDWLGEQGVRVLRIPAIEVMENMDGVLKAIVLAAAPSTSFAGPLPRCAEEDERGHRPSGLTREKSTQIACVT